MLTRLALSLTATAALLVLGYGVEQQRGPLSQAALQQLGERWYALRLDDRHVGYFWTRTAHEPDGAWSYRSRTHILMQPGEPLNIEKQLTFAAGPPHGLQLAEHRVRERDQTLEHVRIERISGALEAQFTSAASRRLDWDYTLADYLDVETWLGAGRQPGDERRTRVLDVSQVRLSRRTYEVADADPYQLTHDAPLGPTRIQLDHQLVPEHMRASGLFQFQRTTFTEAMAPADPALRRSYKLTLEAPLTNIAGIAEIELALSDGSVLLTGKRGAVSGPADAVATARRTLPVSAPEIVALAARATAHVDDPDRALDALVRAAHRTLDYRTGAPSTSVLASLSRGYGECNDFADLLTTLALASGWPARTVYGLAYDENTPAGFAMHAWSEVQVNGRWRSVDATWNQIETDATHIPLDDRTLARLKFMSGSDSDARLRAVRIAYD